MMTTWVVVADMARARFFRVELQEDSPRFLVQQPMKPESSTVLVEIEDLFHPSSRLHDSELASDTPGMSSVAGMPSKFGMDEKVMPKEEEGIRFAKEVAQALKAQSRHFDHLYVVAPSHFLGLLRSDLDKSVMAKIVQEIDKDLSRHGADDIRAHLPESLT